MVSDSLSRNLQSAPAFSRSSRVDVAVSESLVLIAVANADAVLLRESRK